MAISAATAGFCLEEDSAYDSYGVDQRLEKLQIYFETAMFEKAAALLDELILEFPEEPRFIYLRGIVDYQRQDYAPARAVFVKFIQEYPEVAEPYYLLAEICLNSGDEDMAKRYLTRYCELVPEDIDAYQKLESLSNLPDDAVSPTVVIIKNGKQDLALVKRIGFYGACVHSQQAQSLKLVNGNFRTWSSMGIDFAYPLDLRGKKIVLRLKGKQGGERLELTFRDKFASGYDPQLVLVPEETLLSDWRQIEVALGEDQPKIDLSSVVHMGLEFGFSTVQNPANSTLFVKDIIIEDVPD